MATELNLNTAEELNVTVRRGDSMSFDITVKDSDGDPVDLTDYTFDMDIRSRSNVSSKSNRSDIVLSTTTGGKNLLLMSVTGAADGTLTISASREAMANVDAGTYRYDLAANHSENSTSETWFYGKFIVKPDYTLR